MGEGLRGPRRPAAVITPTTRKTAAGEVGLPRARSLQDALALKRLVDHEFAVARAHQVERERVHLHRIPATRDADHLAIEEVCVLRVQAAITSGRTFLQQIVAIPEFLLAEFLPASPALDPADLLAKFLAVEQLVTQAVPERLEVTRWHQARLVHDVPKDDRRAELFELDGHHLRILNEKKHPAP